MACNALHTQMHCSLEKRKELRLLFFFLLLAYSSTLLISFPRIIYNGNLAKKYSNLLKLLISKQISSDPKLNGNQLS